MQIDRPFFVTHLLLENPWPAAVVLVAVAIIFLFKARTQQDARRLVHGLIAVALALLVIAVAKLVDTRRETLIAQTRQLVAATAAPLEMSKVQAMFHPWATLSGPDGTIWMNRQQIEDRLSHAVDVWHLSTQEIQALDADARKRTGRSLLTLRSWPGAPIGDRGITTQWLITWEPDPAEPNLWRVSNVQWLRFQNQPPSASMVTAAPPGL